MYIHIFYIKIIYIPVPLVISEDEEEEEEEESEEEAYYTGTGRRTRVRAAAMVANAMISDMDRTMRSGRRSPVASSATVTEECPKEVKNADPPQDTPEVKPPTSPPKQTSQPILSFGDLLNAQAKYSNETNGFKAFSDIWSFEKKEVISVENNNELSESNSLLSKFKRLQGLRQRNQGIPTEKIYEEASRLSSRCHSSSESSQSGTSTMALHDANEFEETESAVSKELTPPMGLTSDFTMETKDLQLEEKETDAENNTGAPKRKEPNEQRMEVTTERGDMYSRLIQECLTRRAEVRLDKLTPMDIDKLRRLRVLVKRTNLVDYYREQTVQQKRTRISSRGIRSQTHTEDSSGSTNTSGPDSTAKKFVHITSDTPATAVRVVTAKPRFKQLRRFKPTTSDSSTSTDVDERVRSASVRRRRGSKLILKTNKTKHKFHKTKHITADVIELSSDSVSSTSPVPVTQNRFPEITRPLELDPLYEEEVVPFFR